MKDPRPVARHCDSGFVRALGTYGGLLLLSCSSQHPAAPPVATSLAVATSAPIAPTRSAEVESTTAAPDGAAAPQVTILATGGPDFTGCPCRGPKDCGPAQECVCTHGLSANGEPASSSAAVKNGQPGAGRCQFIRTTDINVCVLYGGLLQLPGAESMTPAELAKAAPPAAAPAVQCLPDPHTQSNGQGVVHDFTKREGRNPSEPPRAEREALLARFRHPDAKAGSSCDPNYPGTPAKERAGGILLPSVSVARGAFTRVGAAQSAFFIDYCPTGVGQPRTRRVLVLDEKRVEVDYSCGPDLRADAVLGAVDVDLDGRAELLLTADLFRPNTSTLTVATLLQLAPGKPRVVGNWDAIDHCSVLKKPDQETAHLLSFTKKEGVVNVQDQSKTEKCFYPPAPPP